MKTEHRQVRSRNEVFASRTVTSIWHEQPSDENPYIAKSCLCYGYDLLELMEKRSLVDVMFLLFRGVLPSREQAKLFECLMIALINPGPRHPATRAAMLAGVGKTDPVHILPISLGIFGGGHLGAGEIEESMRFFRKMSKKQPVQVVQDIINKQQRPADGDWHPVPGFGSRFGGIDILPWQSAKYLAGLPDAGKVLKWGCSFAEALEPHGLGWLSVGLAAAIFTDLGFPPRGGAGLFQLISAPGLLAHGLELVNKPITAMPFPPDGAYIIEND